MTFDAVMASKDLEVVGTDALLVHVASLLPRANYSFD